MPIEDYQEYDFVSLHCAKLDNTTSSSNINRGGNKLKQNYTTKECRNVIPENGCILCNMNNRQLSNCEKYARLPAQQRYEITQEKHLCRNCLFTSSHIAANCPKTT